MFTALGGLVILVIALIAIPLSVVIMGYEPRQYRKLVDLEDQRRQIANQIVIEASRASWLTRWRFKRYLRKGGDHL